MIITTLLLPLGHIPFKLRLRAQGGKRKAKDLVKLEQENTTKGKDGTG
jgi:hypothetical protein